MNLEGTIAKDNKILLHRCCNCGEYRTKKGDYVKVDEALKHIYETAEHILISDGYCPQCFKDAIVGLKG